MKKKIRIVATALTALMMSPAVFSAPAFAAFQNNASALQSQLLATIPINASYDLTSNQMAQGPDGTTYVLSGDKVAVISPTGQLKATWPVTTPLTIAISPDGKTVYVAQQNPKYDLNVVFFNAGSGQVANTLVTDVTSGGTYGQNMLWTSPDGGTLYVGGGDSGQSTSYDVTTGNLVSKVYYNGNYVGMTPDGSSVYSLSQYEYDGGNKVYQSNLMLGGQVSYDVSTNGGYENTIGIMPKGGHDIYFDSSGDVVDFSTVSNTSQTIFQSGTSGIPQSPSVDAAYGNYYVVSGNSNNIAVIDMATGTLLGNIQNTDFSNIQEMSLQGNILDVFTTNGLYVYNLGLNEGTTTTGTTTGTTSTGTTSSSTTSTQTGFTNTGTTSTGTTTGTTTTGTSTTTTGTTTSTSGLPISLLMGWNLVDAAVANAAGGSNMFFWNGTSYQTTTNSDGDGVWLYEPSAQSVTLAPNPTAYYSVQANAKQWTMVGNPFSTLQSVTLQQGDYAFTYTPGMGYSSPLTGSVTLQPGQGAWLYSAAGGTYTIGMAPPPPPTTVIGTVYGSSNS